MCWITQDLLEVQIIKVLLTSAMSELPYPVEKPASHSDVLALSWPFYL